MLCVAYDGLSPVVMSICLLAAMGSIWNVEGPYDGLSSVTMGSGLLAIVVCMGSNWNVGGSGIVLDYVDVG